jgi:hypothetical protein
VVDRSSHDIHIAQNNNFPPFLNEYPNAVFEHLVKVILEGHTLFGSKVRTVYVDQDE